MNTNETAQSKALHNAVGRWVDVNNLVLERAFKAIEAHQQHGARSPEALSCRAALRMAQAAETASVKRLREAYLATHSTAPLHHEVGLLLGALRQVATAARYKGRSKSAMVEHAANEEHKARCALMDRWEAST